MNELTSVEWKNILKYNLDEKVKTDLEISDAISDVRKKYW